MERHGGRADALIEVLHELQQHQGYLSEEGLRAVASALAVPLSRVQGVATFYALFALQPPAAHRCAVCMGTACFVAGAELVLAALQQRLGPLHQGRRGDGGWMLEAVGCVGACSQAPVLLLNRRLSGSLAAADPPALERQLGALGLPHHAAGPKERC